MSEDKIVQKIQDTLKKQVAKDTDMIFESLVVKPDNRTLPEELFVNYFLPYFAGNTPEEYQQEVIEKWITIASSAMHEVDIVSPSGIVLFTVPSLFDTSSIDTINRNVGNSLSDIYAQYELKGNNIPAVAETYLSKELSKKLSIVKDNPNMADTESRWKSIFDRYNVVSNLSVNTAVVEDDPTDDLEYS